MSGLHLPPAEPPDELTAAALEALAGARAELREASHIIALLKISTEGEPAGGLFLARREIELRVAEYRLALWSDEVRRREGRVRSFGLRP